jgi:hypothetical protein
VLTSFWAKCWGCGDSAAQEAETRLSDQRSRTVFAKAYAGWDGTLRYLLDTPFETLYQLFPPEGPPPDEAGALRVLTEEWVHTPGALEWLRATVKTEYLH